MLDIAADLPAHFWDVVYDGTSTPLNTPDLAGRANCQVFAYAVLKHFGRVVPPLRSSELWTDPTGISAVAPLEPLDLLLFAPTTDPFGAHVAVSLGDDRALHLAKQVGRPAIWTLAQFAALPEYRVLLGGRRYL
ncbi:hypothetical protein [Devosia sp.]|jgi:lipoprotein Spr|uniref:hypothetical protein n=1 Tax=Devosia sp. TaxID=1871048 RepID=UPI0037C09FE1